MTIEQLYENWMIDIDDVTESKKALKEAEDEAERSRQLLLATIYEKRDTHLKNYGEHTIQSGSSVFSFELAGKSGTKSIENFKKVKFKSLDN